MLNVNTSIIGGAFVALVCNCATAAPITITKLTGVTGGTIAATAVFRADLSGFGDISSITIQDNSSGLGGAPGQFSGFDLDAIILSETLCSDAACVQGLTGLSVFDFASGTVFTPGTQRSPTDPKLFGTGAGGNTLDNAVATLGAFDGESTTAIPGAFGFISLGDNGKIAFDFAGPVSTTGRYLYLGEVGDNGEVAASSITVTQVPEPGALALLGLGLASLAATRRRKQ